MGDRDVVEEQVEWAGEAEKCRRHAKRSAQWKELASPRSGTTGISEDRPASPPADRTLLAGAEAVGNKVELENVHPLRLRLLLAIERTGSISGGARECAIAQASASMHLRTLEMAVGQKLVTRSRGGSSLTAAGEVVASHARQVLAALQSMVRTLENRDPRQLSVAASLTPAVVLLPRALRQFSDRYPGVSVMVRTLPSEGVVREIARAEADIGIAGEVPDAETVVRNELVVDELVGIGPADLPVSNGGSLSLGDLARNSLLLGTDASSTRVTTEDYLARAGYRPARVWIFDSYVAIKQAVAEGVGVSFISRQLVRDEVRRGELKTFRVSGVEPMMRPLYVMQSPMSEAAAHSSAFMTLLREAAWKNSAARRRNQSATPGS